MTNSSRSLLVVTPYFFPHLGGVEKHVLETSLLLKRAGWQVEIITKQHEPDLPRSEKQDDLTVHRFSFAKIKCLGLIFLWARLLQQYWRLFKNAPVIHVHDVMIWVLPFRILMPRKKFILTMHGWEGIFPLPKKNIWLKKLSAILANQVICTGEYISRHYQVSCEAVAEGGVSESFVKLVQRSATKNKTTDLLYVGRLAPDTGLPVLLTALAQLEARSAKVTVKFAGDGELRGECEQWGDVLGWQDEAQLAKQLTKAKTCLAGGYLAALEALVAGCQVIVVAEHQLKNDYWQLSSLAKNIEVVESAEKMASLLKKTSIDTWNRSAISPKQLLKRYGWQQVVKLYLEQYSG